MTVSPKVEAAARALCAEDFHRIQEPTRQQYIDAQWPNYVSRAEAAIKAYMETTE